MTTVTSNKRLYHYTIEPVLEDGVIRHEADLTGTIIAERNPDIRQVKAAAEQYLRDYAEEQEMS